MKVRFGTEQERQWLAEAEGVPLSEVPNLLIAEDGYRKGHTAFTAADFFHIHSTESQEPMAYTVLILRAIDEAKRRGYDKVRFFVGPPMTDYKRGLIESKRTKVVATEGENTWLDMEI